MNVPRHIVAVAGLVTDARGRVLMIRSPRRGWEFPGGQVEEGESLVAALRREVVEETGIAVSVGELAGVYSNVKSHIVMFGFLCRPTGGEPAASAESLEVEWVERGRVLSRIARPPIRDRMRDLLEFDGRVVYRAYAFDASEGRATTPKAVGRGTGTTRREREREDHEHSNGDRVPLPAGGQAGIV